MSVRGGVSRRALVLYLGTIVGPTLVLLFLGLQSVYRQRQALDDLTLANLRLSAERAAAGLQRQVETAVDACFRDPRLASVVRDDLPIDAAAARRVRAALDAVRRQHPLAQHLFVLDGTRLGYPLLRPPFPATVDLVLDAEAPTNRSRVASLFGDAERAELSGSSARAAAAYGRCAAAAHTTAIQAMALLGEARCLQRVHDEAAAAALFDTVAERFGDEFDLSWRPIAIAAGLERFQMLSAAGPELLPVLLPPSRQLAGRLRADLLRGRWEVSAEQLEYFDSELARYAPMPPGDDGFARELRLARAFEQQFQPAAALHPLDAHPFAFSAAGQPYQAYYAALDPSGTGRLVALAVDPASVARLLPAASAAAGVTRKVSLVQRGRRARPGFMEIPFAAQSFPFLALSVELPLPLAGLSRSPGELVLFTGGTLLIMTVLVLGVVLLVRDVARDAEMNRVRADFVSGVSHELKTPLTVIRLYAENLLDDPDAPSAERQRSYQVLTRESERLTRLIERVLRFSRVEHGRDRYALGPVCLPSVVREITGVYGQQLRRSGFCLQVDVDESVPDVRGDPDAISEAVINLLDNAAKYSGDSRDIRVAVARRGSSAVVEIQDRGVGIAAADQHRVFERFYRSQGTGKGGYGLGLFLVAHTMSAHSGSIELESEPGRGSVFRLVFPLAASPAAQE